MKLKFWVLAVFSILAMGLLSTTGCEKAGPSSPTFSQPTLTPTPNWTSSAPEDVTAATYNEEVTNCNIPVCVVYWAAWCPACTYFDPTVSQFASDEAGKVKVVRINFDQNPTLASNFNITVLPTSCIVKNHNIVNKVIGAVPESTLKAQF